MSGAAKWAAAFILSFAGIVFASTSGFAVAHHDGGPAAVLMILATTCIGGALMLVGTDE